MKEENCKYIEEPCHEIKCDKCKVYKYLFPSYETSEEEFEKQISKK